MDLLRLVENAKSCVEVRAPGALQLLSDEFDSKRLAAHLLSDLLESVEPGAKEPVVPEAVLSNPRLQQDGLLLEFDFFSSQVSFKWEGCWL